MSDWNAVTHCNHLREDLPKKIPVNVWEGDILLFSCTSKSDYGTNTLVCQTLFMKLFFLGNIEECKHKQKVKRLTGTWQWYIVGLFWLDS